MRAKVKFRTFAFFEKLYFAEAHESLLVGYEPTNSLANFVVHGMSFPIFLPK